MTRLFQIWIALRSSFWFVPSVMVFASIALAIGLIELDVSVSLDLQAMWPRLFGAGAEGSRGMLTAIATSMITVAGVTFSITIAALAQAAQQYTPRVLRTFMRDRGNQITLGVFSGIFTYCLVVLRTIRGGSESFVPSIAVLVSFVLALLGIAVLIYFIHHTASMLQPDEIIAAAAEETIAETRSTLVCTDEADASAPTPGEVTGLTRGREWHPIHAAATGYVRIIDLQSLAALAEDHDLVVRIVRPVGSFAVIDTPVALAAAATRPAPEVVVDLQHAFAMAKYRTVEQDPAFGIRLIADIAIKALSPAVNDPTTAITCINHLTAILSDAARCSWATARRGSGGEIRLLDVAPDFGALVALAFDETIASARDLKPINHLVGCLTLLAGRSTTALHRDALMRQLERIDAHLDHLDVPDAHKQMTRRGMAAAVAALADVRH